MSEGEFEKRMQKQFLSNRYSQMTDLNPILDMARKEFPRHIDGHGGYVYSVIELEKWFLKWFGDESK